MVIRYNIENCRHFPIKNFYWMKNVNIFFSRQESTIAIHHHSLFNVTRNYNTNNLNDIKKSSENSNNGSSNSSTNNSSSFGKKLFEFYLLIASGSLALQVQYYRRERQEMLDKFGARERSLLQDIQELKEKNEMIDRLLNLPGSHTIISNSASGYRSSLSSSGDQHHDSVLSHQMTRAQKEVIREVLKIGGNKHHFDHSTTPMMNHSNLKNNNILNTKQQVQNEEEEIELPKNIIIY